MKYFFIVLMVLLSEIAFAHQSDLSSIVISKTENGKVVIQIISSLTAFQGEINYHNPKNSYKTPEDFRNLIIKHFYNTFSIVLNEKDTLDFINPTVLLGHETKIVAEIIGIPNDVNSIHLKNEYFKDIHNNQSVVIFSLEGFPSKTNYELNNDNEHELNIILKDGIWKTYVKNDLLLNLKYLPYLIILLIGSSIFYFIRKRKTRVEQHGI